MGELVARFVRKAYPHDTAKAVARKYDLKLTAAENLTKGHCSERALTKALRAEGWPLMMALGEAMTGESYEQFLRGISDELEKQRRSADAHRDHIRSLETRASSVLASLVGQAA